ncbi:hypothetical protein LVY75_07970 (plasmid) [Sinorhizobium sp. B11]
MKRNTVLDFVERVARLFDRRPQGRMIEPVAFEETDRQRGLEYELSFWRAAAPVWY